MNPTATASDPLDRLLPSLGRTGAAPAALALLVAHQRDRRLLTLRALLDAVRGAPPGSLPEGAAERVLADWRLLEDAERADRDAARRVVQYSLVGAWAEHCLRALVRPGQAGQAAADLPYLGAIAAAAAARAGTRFEAAVPVRTGGVVTLPTLGRYVPPAGSQGPAGPAGHRIRVTGDGGRLLLHLDARFTAYGRTPLADATAGAPAGAAAAGTVRGDRDARYARAEAALRVLRPPASRTVEIRRGPDGVWRSAAAGWRPVRALRAAGSTPVLLDDADPYRDDEAHAGPYALAALDGLDAGAHALWRTAWQDAQPWLRLGDGSRAREADLLLDAFVPLGGSPTAQCSATKRDAFGALLTTTPRNGLELAATLVHELQHAKLLALSGLTPLHTAGDQAAYWAPWRRDPRPFDGLFQGAYAHLALADFHLAVALATADPAVRDSAWADHCRCRQQVAAALPQMRGSSRLTAHGRVLVDAMAAHHARLAEQRPPAGHLARATAYVETARALWHKGNGR
ncbi:HEXXH motif-containing putative peptide modification protein [Streptomyces sp. V4-01]|uniref:HEXXH motif-containing putative peptide modification protein n=1 Tax=Actinacidiphila polyblastidii TaxID=3110430 RepID=A0ABU7PBS6_9ACTN|nr:HEXXH motif-containing putative peptide modification protein [Streptomyces sp. V4-01]